jgi:hypothetical protein
VFDKAIDFAEPIGQLRHASAVRELGLNFEDFGLRRFRDRRTGDIRRKALFEALRQRTQGPMHDLDLLEDAASESPRGLRVCQGKDLIQAIVTVIHQDYGASLNSLQYVPELFRSVDDALFEEWTVVKRIRSWEEINGIQILG